MFWRKCNDTCVVDNYFGYGVKTLMLLFLRSRRRICTINLTDSVILLFLRSRLLLKLQLYWYCTVPFLGLSNIFCQINTNIFHCLIWACASRIALIRCNEQWHNASILAHIKIMGVGVMVKEGSWGSCPLHLTLTLGTLYKTPPIFYTWRIMRLRILGRK